MARYAVEEMDSHLCSYMRALFMLEFVVYGWESDNAENEQTMSAVYVSLRRWRRMARQGEEHGGDCILFIRTRM